VQGHRWGRSRSVPKWATGFRIGGVGALGGWAVASPERSVDPAELAEPPRLLCDATTLSANDSGTSFMMSQSWGVDGFRAYLGRARKKGPDPYWVVLTPVHRIFSYPVSYLYASAGITPVAVSMVGLLLTLASVPLILLGSGVVLIVGVVALKLASLHDYCDGEVARDRIARGIQSIQVTRIGMFADIWVFTVVLQGLLPLIVGVYAWRHGAPGYHAVLGVAAALVLSSAYVVQFGRSAYWPQRAPDLTKTSPTMAADGLLAVARKVYYQLFEMSTLSTHAAVVLVVWELQGGTPIWGVVYSLIVSGVTLAAFLVGHVSALRAFDRVQ
jgi:hypothetical protein